MALTRFQRAVCRLIAANRVERGESYVAGGTALNLLAFGTRISRDIDIFHDTNAALEAAWADDRSLLAANGYEVRPRRYGDNLETARLPADLAAGALVFHAGSIRGAFPGISGG